MAIRATISAEREVLLMHNLMVTDEELDALVHFCEVYDGTDPRLVALAVDLTERFADRLEGKAA